MGSSRGKILLLLLLALSLSLAVGMTIETESGDDELEEAMPRGAEEEEDDDDELEEAHPVGGTDGFPPFPPQVGPQQPPPPPPQGNRVCAFISNYRYNYPKVCSN